MISKELLSEVLGYDATPSFAIEVKGDGIYSPGINIYELAHKCKEWAWGNEFELKPARSRENNDGFEYVCNVFLKTYWYKDKDQYPEAILYSKTEPEAIFKACEWILNEAKND